MQRTPTKRPPLTSTTPHNAQSGTLATRATTPVNRGDVPLSVEAEPVQVATPTDDVTGHVSAQLASTNNATATGAGDAADNDGIADIPLPNANEIGKHLPATPVVVACGQCLRSRRCHDHQLRLAKSVRSWLQNVHAFNSSSLELRRERRGKALPRSLGAKILSLIHI